MTLVAARPEAGSEWVGQARKALTAMDGLLAEYSRLTGLPW